jgi:hypothetical protein
MIGPLTVGWQMGVIACALTTPEESWKKPANRIHEASAEPSDERRDITGILVPEESAGRAPQRQPDIAYEHRISGNVAGRIARGFKPARIFPKIHRPVVTSVTDFLLAARLP